MLEFGLEFPWILIRKQILCRECMIPAPIFNAFSDDIIMMMTIYYDQIWNNGNDFKNLKLIDI